jgi:hypothetical protein
MVNNGNVKAAGPISFDLETATPPLGALATLYGAFRHLQIGAGVSRTFALPFVMSPKTFSAGAYTIQARILPDDSIGDTPGDNMITFPLTLT